MVCFIIIDYSKMLKRTLRLFIVVISVSVVSPTALLSQSPSLGAANNFALFTAAGAMTGTAAATQITGNIGTDAGLITLYDPPTVITGTVYHGPDAVTNQVKIDVLAAHTDLVGRAGPTRHVPAYGLAFPGETLFAGLYDNLGAASLAGILILDAQNVPSATFIFQIPGAFAVGADAVVELINGAQACNVFWAASSGATAGALSLGADVVMKGTLITDLGALAVGARTRLEGRMLTLDGAVTTDTDTIWIPPACTTLPIELISFKGYRSGEGSAVLKWSTASEINNDFFTVERSPDAVNWEVVGSVEGAGNSTEQIDYEFTDFSCPNKATYYRLKQTDFDEKFKYESKIQIEKHKDPDQLFIHIDPLNNYLNIVNKEGMEDIKAIHIYNLYGNEIYHSTINQSRIDISNFKNGSYVISIYLKSEIRTLKFIVYKN
jgi:hypothetical protein